MINCAIYPRKSKADEKSESMEVQIAMCTEYLDKHYPDNYTVTIYDGDYGISGHSIKKRKDFQRMMNDVKCGKIQLVVIQRYDRIARNIRDFCNIYYEMEKNNCNLVSVSQQIDTTTPYGKNFMIQQAAFAELEWSLVSERQKDVNRHAAKIGKCNLSPHSIPFGYTTKYIDGVRRMVKNPDEEHIVMDLFKYYANTRNKRGTRRYIFEKYGITITEMQMKGIAKSPFYKGCYRDNPNYCEPYLTESEWNDLQRKKPQIREQKHEAYVPLFAGLVRCPVCGHVLTVSRHGYDKNKKRRVLGHLKCRYHYMDGCSFRSHLSELKFEKRLIDYINNELPDRLIEIEAKAFNTPELNYEQKLERIEKELARLNNMYLKGRISEEIYDTEYSRLDREKAILEAENKPQDSIKKVKEVFVGNWEQLYQQLTPINRRAFWSRIIKEIVINKQYEIIEILWC